ncbi:MAG TPA: aldo/keto reductase [Verrucomicrobiae bacterium]|jgi:aryl-alcohol dehydrogenase-like predicted oxidoreductase|nr:aldo/keto reductase [Verrucomicrobiae bacterium]
MRTRILGKTDLKVTELGLGCQSLGGSFHYKDDKEALAVLSAALDAGINFFDTADSYALGHSERLIGKALKGRRDKAVITTKAGYVYTRLGTVGQVWGPRLSFLSPLLRPFRAPLNEARYLFQYRNFSPRHLAGAAEASLRRLETDYVDLFLLHDPSPKLLEIEEIWQTLEKLKREGKVRHYGISCITEGDAMDFLKRMPVPVQVTVNLIDQEALDGLLPHAAQTGAGIIARLPFARGLLTGASDTKADQVTRHPKVIAERKKRAEKFRFLAKEGRSMAQAALRFVLDQPGISTVIPGVSRRAHLKEALAALDLPALSAEEMAAARETNRPSP